MYVNSMTLVLIMRNLTVQWLFAPDAGHLKMPRNVDRLNSVPGIYKENDPKHVRFTKVVRRKGMRCAKCNRFTHFQTLDHIKRITDGGSRWNLENMQILCRECHQSKDNTMSLYGLIHFPRHD